MKKLLILFALLLLTSCSTSNQPVVIGNTDNVDEELTTILQTTQKIYFHKKGATKNNEQNYGLRFNGFSNQLKDGTWIIALSKNENWEVDNFFIVKENSTINFFGEKIDIIKLEPEKNQITIKENKHD